MSIRGADTIQGQPRIKPAISLSAAPRDARRSLFLGLLVAWLVIYHVAAICWFGTAKIDGTRYYLVDDDVMITMRYGRNLARGQGLVYNAGERVEGFTNPLLTFVAAGLHVLPIEPRFIPLLIDILNGFLSIFILLALTRFWIHEPNGASAGLWSGLFYVLLSQHLYYAYAGYEVYMQAAMLLFCLARFDRLGAFGACVLGMLPLSHATMMVPWAVLVAALGWKHRKDLDRKWPVLLLAVAPFAAYECFRIAYYHDVLPNTYWLKVGGGSIGGGLRYAAGWACRVAPVACLALFAFSRRHWLVGLMGLAIAASVAEAISVGGDIFPLSRFLFPSSVLLAALAGRGVMVLIDRMGVPSGTLRIAPRVAVAALLLVALAIPLAEIRQNAQEFLAVDHWQVIHLVLGQAISRNTPQGSTVALFGLGYTGYYCERPVIDMLGKADRHIARTKPHPGRRLAHNKSDFDYVLAKGPDYIELGLDPNRAANAKIGPNNQSGYSEELALKPLFRQLYLPYPVVDAKGRFCHLYARTSALNRTWNVSESFYKD